MMILTEAIDINNKRFAGEKADILFKNKRLINKKKGAVYTLCTSPEEIPLIDLLPGNINTDDLASNTYFNAFSESEIEDLLLFLESLLRSLTYEESNSSYVNKRLNFFCFKNLLFINDFQSKDLQLKYGNELLKRFLFFNPSSENYISKFSFINKSLKYKRRTVDMQLVLNALENFSIRKYNKSQSPVSKTRMHYDELYKLLSEIITGIFKEDETIKNVNTEEEKLYFLFKENRQLFYEKLKEALNYYTLASWEDKIKAPSLFYSAKKIEDMPPPIFISSSQKRYESEYLVDFFIFYFAGSVRNLKQAVHYLSSDANELKKFLTIVFSHPFITYNNIIKRAFAQSGLIKILPEGYAKSKLQKYQQQYSAS